MKTVKQILSAHAKTMKALRSLTFDLNKEDKALLAQQEALSDKIDANNLEYRRAGAAITYLGGLFDAVEASEDPEEEDLD